MVADLHQVTYHLVVALTPFTWHRVFYQLDQTLALKNGLNVREYLCIPIERTLLAEMSGEKMVRGESQVGYLPRCRVYET